MIRILFIVLLFPSYIKAQVGINTNEPEHLVHIQGKASTNLALDDVVVTEDGKLGIGTNAPTAKLEIVTGGTKAIPKNGFKMVDGSQIDTYVLTSDQLGRANWQPI